MAAGDTKIRDPSLWRERNAPPDDARRDHNRHLAEQQARTHAESAYRADDPHGIR